MKKLLVILLLCLPIFVFADECDYQKKNELARLANYITYETSYSKSTDSFTVTFYNMIPGLALEYKTNIYSGNSSNEIKIIGIKEGTSMKVTVNVSGLNCTPFLRTLYINLPYYNNFYGSKKCEDYKDKITVCSSQFLNYDLTEDLLDKAIENHNGGYQEEPDPIPVVDPSGFEIVLEFVQDYGIKIALIAISSLITIAIFNVIYRKVKHKI